jgi:hypothetical protein
MVQHLHRAVFDYGQPGNPQEVGSQLLPRPNTRMEAESGWRRTVGLSQRKAAEAETPRISLIFSGPGARCRTSARMVSVVSRAQMSIGYVRVNLGG